MLAAAGVWAPLAFILPHAVGVCLFIPGTLLSALGPGLLHHLVEEALGSPPPPGATGSGRARCDRAASPRRSGPGKT